MRKKTVDLVVYGNLKEELEYMYLDDDGSRFSVTNHIIKSNGRYWFITDFIYLKWKRFPEWLTYTATDIVKRKWLFDFNTGYRKISITGPETVVDAIVHDYITDYLPKLEKTMETNKIHDETALMTINNLKNNFT